MFPALYTAHHGTYQEDLPFWLDLAAQQKGTVLELGCGSGRVLLPLARAGFRTVGLDNDLDMLVYLCAHCPKHLDPLPLVFVGDLCNFQLGAGFPLIILPCNTWSTLSQGQRAQALGCIRQHLLPSGLFAVSVPSPDLLRSLPARSDPIYEDSYPHPDDGSPVQVSSGWRRGTAQFTVTWHYDHLLPDGSVQRHTVRLRHDLSSADQYQQELIAAGLAIQAVYGDFDGTAYSPNSQELILVARR